MPYSIIEIETVVNVAMREFKKWLCSLRLFDIDPFEKLKNTRYNV